MNSIRKLVTFFLFPFALFKIYLFRLLGVEQVTILIFHDVAKEDYAKFSRLITFLNNTFGFISPDDLKSYMDGNLKLNGPKFLISFDDGFISSYNVTKDILEPLNIKSIFFVCSNFITVKEEDVPDFIVNKFFLTNRSPELVNSDRYPIRIEKLVELQEFGHEIAAHTSNHANLPTLSVEEIESELKQCKDYLERTLDREVNTFAFPFGGIGFINQDAQKAIAKYFKYSHSGVRGDIKKNITHKLCIPRSSVTLSESYIMQLSLLFGSTNFMHKNKLTLLENFLGEDK